MRGALVLGVLLVAPFAGRAAAEPPKGGLVERSRLEVQPGGKAIEQLSIENPLGDVRVEGYDGTSIQIETHKHAPDEQALERLRVSLVPNPDGTVRIATTADGGKEYKDLARSAIRIDLIVRAPRDARVEAVVSAGKLELINMDAGGDLDTASGPILVRNVAGMLSTHSVTGPTSLAQVFGSVDAQTLASDVELDTIGGERLVASVNRGKIAGRRVRARNIELTTTNGTIVLEGEASLRGRLVVSSFKGDIDVRLRRQGVVVLRARGVRVNLGATATTTHPDGWIHGQLGQFKHTTAAAYVELRSRHGNVQFALID